MLPGCVPGGGSAPNPAAVNSRDGQRGGARLQSRAAPQTTCLGKATGFPGGVCSAPSACEAGVRAPPYGLRLPKIRLFWF